METIRIRGARTHNLKNINLDLPRNRLIVITGLSGSGKSSLAFDTLYAEGQRRYVESLSAYARQFLQLMEKPDVDLIEGLSPAISIEQKATSHNPRSTVGTVTEIHDYLRLLFARAGTPYCPDHNQPLEAQTVSQMVDTVLALPAAATILGTLTVLDPQSAGHTTVWPCSQGRPATSVNNVTAPGQRTVNSTAVTTDPDGSFCIYSSMAAHLVWDAQRGAPEIQAGASQRVLDTRAGEPLAAEGELRVHAGPARATVAGNLTVVAPQGSGHTTVWTCGEQRPTASTNNFVVGETTPNFAVVRTDAAGDFCVYSTAQTHLLWDQASENSLPSHQATRILDTRRASDGARRIPAGTTIGIDTGLAAGTVLGTLTAVGASGPGHLRVFPCGQPMPNSSALSIQAGQNRATGVASRTSADGRICVYAAATTYIVWDQVAESAQLPSHSPTRLLDTRG